jgi:uncharacterized membrane protein (UPF0127 family)
VTSAKAMTSPVLVRNATRGRVLAGAAEIARGPIRRGMGLMRRRGWFGSDALLLEHCNSVHSFFMRMPIDVAYLDKGGRVMRMVSSMRPWRVGPIVWSADSVLELPAGALARSGTAEGDRLELAAACP